MSFLANGHSISFGILALALSASSCGARDLQPPTLSPSPVASATIAPADVASPALSGLHFEIGAVDRHVDPCTDFYDYACGGWRATHPIPPEETLWDRYAEMSAVNAEHERAIVEEAALAKANVTPAEQRVGAYYTACMDEAAIEQRGLAPLREVLRGIDAIRSKDDVARVMADLHAHGIDAGFSIYARANPRDAAQIVIWLDKGSLGLPSPSDYTKTDEAAVLLRKHYVEHLEKLFQLVGSSAKDAHASAARILTFETSMAAVALSAVDRRRLENQDHSMTSTELAKRFPSVNWPLYFAQVDAPPLDHVNVAQPAWLDALNGTLSKNDFAGLRDDMRMLVIRFAAKGLPKAIENEVFDFNQRIVRGAKEMAPRSRRCLGLLDRDLGGDVGRIFVARYFKDDARARMASMVAALINAYRADISSRDWLGAAARAAASAKLEKMLLVIGASNRPRSYEGLRIDAQDPFGNAWRAQVLDVKHGFSRVGKQADREEFFDSLPQELDGFGSKTMNATGFTAGFLQPPLLDPRVDDAVNFGGLGSVIGHELTHQFDDEGHKFDGDGNLRPWWSPEDVAHFEERAQCFADEYSRFHTDEGKPLDGKLSLGENIADNGGIRLSYAALKPAMSGPTIDGYTPAQRFFIAWGQIRCENATPETARRLAETNEHAPGRFRVNGVVSNVPEFAQAFSCAAGKPMAPAKRCSLW